MKAGIDASATLILCDTAVINAIRRHTSKLLALLHTRENRAHGDIILSILARPCLFLFCSSRRGSFASAAAAVLLLLLLLGVDMVRRVGFGGCVAVGSGWPRYR
jgi:hypothetical protein